MTAGDYTGGNDTIELNKKTATINVNADGRGTINLLTRTGNWAVDIYANYGASTNPGSLVFNGNLNINTVDNMVRNLSDGYTYVVMVNDAGSSATFNGDLNINFKGNITSSVNELNTYGLSLENGKITTNGSFSLQQDVTTTDAVSYLYGALAWSRSPSSLGKTTITLGSTPDNTVIISGILNKAGSIAETYGLYSGGDRYGAGSKIDVVGSAFILNIHAENTTPAVGAYAYASGAEAGANGQINFLANTTIKDVTAGGLNAEAYALTAYNGGIINVNPSNSALNTIKIYGNIDAQSAGKVNLNLNNAGSYLASVISSNNNGIVNLGLANRAIFDMTSSTAGSYNQSNITTLSGNGGILLVNTDFTDLEHPLTDKLTVTGSVSGQYVVAVKYDPFWPDWTKIVTPGAIVLDARSASGSIMVQGQKANADMGVYNITYKPVVVQDDVSNVWKIVGFEREVENTPRTSTTVDSSAIMNNNMLAAFRLINNDLHKRMGELLFNPNSGGIWLRTYTGEASLRNSGTQKYYVIQGGVDHVHSGKDGRSFSGVAIENIHTDNVLQAGSGRTQLINLGLYQAWLGNKGHYYDIVGKVYKLNNRMDIIDSNGQYVHGDYNSHAYGLSMEYGYRHELGRGYYLTPQAEFTYRHINGTDYTTSNNINISYASTNTLIGRLGLTIGRKFDNNSQLYLTGNILREFLANNNITARDSFGQSIVQNVGYKENWYNLALGATFKNGKKNDWYLEIERSFGSSCNTKWQAQVGSRWSW